MGSTQGYGTDESDSRNDESDRLDDYGFDESNFKWTYRCYNAVNKPQVESGDKVILPQSALHSLATTHMEYPMLFELWNPSTEHVAYCGVLEFTAEEGELYMPNWMMENMHLQEGDYVEVKNGTLRKGTYVKLQPHTNEFLDISNLKAILETTLRSFTCLTTGDRIMLGFNNKKYYINIVETRPTPAVCIIDTDCEVDFAPPLDYNEPQRSATTLSSSQTLEKEELSKEFEKFIPFTGVGRRLDGKHSSNIQSPNPSNPSNQKEVQKEAPKEDLLKEARREDLLKEFEKLTPFTGVGRRLHGMHFSNIQSPNSSTNVQNPSTNIQKEALKKEPKFQAFSGKNYRLRE
ncbi:ubiquitin fusion degradation protein 1 homolog [Amborella trichopoda]|uniref:ubiquitin fusion degradation protein 1 homolog n=1 Tax=Amborella trichopoda TaxID=13333 RepID=UPI0009BDADEE|nr:ubiquitin fusion degradation protein 1 homolog [Amborella trichopoda]|eukprot:XP_020527714.1 ubiquitin fusion degradation protein 1 homolog [Amborella trichopoda]